MSCGDFIELTKAYETYVLAGKTVVKANPVRDHLRQMSKHVEVPGQQ